MCLHFIVDRLCLMSSHHNYEVMQNWLDEKEERQLQDSRIRNILLHTQFEHLFEWSLPHESVGPSFFQKLKCPVTECVVTRNRYFLNQITDYDAIILHVDDNMSESLQHMLPEHRVPSQIYIKANRQSPAKIKKVLGRMKNLFNWTMSFRLDSEVLWNFGNVVDINSGNIVGPVRHMLHQWRSWNRSYFDDSFMQLVQRKRKMAVQLNADCSKDSLEKKLIRQIKMYIAVDQYGDCAEKKCSNTSDCTRLLNDDYKFFLAFERALCKDYISEDLYTALRNNIIPVVFGAAEYWKFIPPHSYIDVQEFGSVQQLVEYLQYLVNNPHEYVKYFWWKQYYRIEESLPFCELCRKIHDIGARERIQHYRNIDDWWYDSVCQTETMILHENGMIRGNPKRYPNYSNLLKRPVKEIAYWGG
ncbi:alpha-(1,3)-fucosyltransferase C-like [Uranotaenia lowii]|uniref:alpha-(1,3)-fucosyltransferase C-like n=1 Tax=Uranotaenia lowii TaxID=190385 RepID=UPI00247ADEA3|nr:alpha-(1,3)-fucosyltransferase C-like [Uranotaenia lowii]